MQEVVKDSVTSRRGRTWELSIPREWPRCGRSSAAPCTKKSEKKIERERQKEREKEKAKIKS
ncbi:hypothetical protein C0Q70_11625 [Pomacea canaliculata]|uniref:Uncharacterized protein n=1 Tax=Pomacea canaliculata TaxID=400727 RepID=A0A2T7P6H7_POMCA|nr:hypothetical protein C0Q70_11625 [Pomacea canaliculata]